MPELPEVECFVRSIRSEFLGHTLKNITIYRNELRIPFDIPGLKKIFAKGETLFDISRAGKRLVLKTSKGVVYISLGMTGKFILQHDDVSKKHEHISLQFENGKELIYVDPRRFGFWTTTPPKNSEEIADAINEKALLKLFNSEKTTKSRRKVKTFLLDQNLIGGIGNIYAVEALFEARVNPEELCCNIKASVWKKMAKIITDILTESIKAGGSSISTYKRLDGATGGFQKLHKVYGKEGEKCVTKNCTALIIKTEQSGRSTWHCPNCQKLN